MAEGNGTTVEVDLILADSEKLHVGKSDNTESLVDLESINILLLDTGVLESLRHGERGSGGELGRLVSSLTPTQDLSNGLQAELLELGLGNENDGSSTVGERRGVGSGNSAILGLERGSESLGLGLVEVLGLVVLVNDNIGLASATADLDRSNLLTEPATLLGLLSLLVGSNTVVILGLSVETVLLGAGLAGKTHVLVLVGISETVLQDSVNERLVAELGAGAHVGKVVGSVGHGLGTTSNDDVGTASHDGLGTENDGLGGGCADLVDGGADDRVGNASTESALAGRVLTKTGREDVAEDDLLDGLGLDTSSLDGMLDGVGTELGGAKAGKRAIQRKGWLELLSIEAWRGSLLTPRTGQQGFWRPRQCRRGWKEPC